VLQVSERAQYTITHRVDGVDYTPSPKGIPASLGPLPVGSRLHCYYYRSDPDNVFFAPRKHPWPAPIPLALLAVGVAVCSEGFRRRIRSRRRPPVDAAMDDPPAAPLPPAPPRGPLEIPLQEMFWLRSILGGIVLIPLSLCAAALTWLSWGTGGDAITSGLALILMCNAPMLPSAFVVFYSSGLVFDSARGLFYHWRGMPRPWLHTYRPLAAIAKVEIDVYQARQGKVYSLVLRFQDDSVLEYTLGYSPEEPYKILESVKQYLRDARP
jgi:hypothetical protein